MATYWIKEPHVTINTVDLSDHVKEVGLELSQNEIDAVVGGDDAMRRFATHKDWQLQIRFAQDFAAGEVDATLWGVHDGGVGVAVILRPTTAAKGAANPEYTGTGIMPSYEPFGGGVGDEAIAPVTFRCSNGVGMARATT